MTLTVSSGGGGARIRCIDLTGSSRNSFSTFRPVNFPYPSRPRHLVVPAAKKDSGQTGRFDSKKRRSLVPTKKTEEQSENIIIGFNDEKPLSLIELNYDDDDRTAVDSRYRGDPKYAPRIALKDLEGFKPDPVEGPKWDGLGFFVQYLWAFGFLFAVISALIAAATYNEGATDFKETPVYKEAIQSRDLLDEAESSNSEDVFESNPTEVAPSLE